MNALIEFFSFTDPNIRMVTFGVMLLGIASGVVGTFTYLRKRALLGDAISHSILPGICFAFILSGTKNPIYLMVGAFISGWLSLILIDYLSSERKLKPDTNMAIVLSVFFAIGILLLTNIQHSGNANQSGLDSYLFGKAASMNFTDVKVFASISLILILTTILLFKPFMLLCFNREYAKVIGLPVRRYELILSSLTILAIATGIQAVGIILMAALLITPAAAARFWTHKLTLMLLLSAGFGAFAGLCGSFVSYTAPSMPTGPWIVIVLTCIAILSMLIAPNKGWLAKKRKQQLNRQKVLSENILKSFYKLGESNNDFYSPRMTLDILENRAFTIPEAKKGLSYLSKKSFIYSAGDGFKLSEKGFLRAKKLVRLHRLWELYLTKKLHLASDHVHHDAEAIEHIITPEFEALLSAELGNPTTDPHHKNIPQ